MKENNIQTIDPAEACECDPEWSSAPGSNEWGECRCSIVSPVEATKNQKKEKS